jgi:hypothetical protein
MLIYSNSFPFSSKTYLGLMRNAGSTSFVYICSFLSSYVGYETKMGYDCPRFCYSSTSKKFLIRGHWNTN